MANPPAGRTVGRWAALVLLVIGCSSCTASLWNIYSPKHFHEAAEVEIYSEPDGALLLNLNTDSAAWPEGRPTVFRPTVPTRVPVESLRAGDGGSTAAWLAADLTRERPNEGSSVFTFDVGVTTPSPPDGLAPWREMGALPPERLPYADSSSQRLQEYWHSGFVSPARAPDQPATWEEFHGVALGECGLWWSSSDSKDLIFLPGDLLRAEPPPMFWMPGLPGDAPTTGRRLVWRVLCDVDPGFRWPWAGSSPGEGPVTHGPSLSGGAIELPAGWIAVMTRTAEMHFITNADPGPWRITMNVFLTPITAALDTATLFLWSALMDALGQDDADALDPFLGPEAPDWLRSRESKRPPATAGCR